MKQITIYSWMIDLKLKGNDLLVYAIIANSFEEKGYYDDTLEYLQYWTNSTRQGVIKNLQHLEELNLITKEKESKYRIYRLVNPQEKEKL